MSDCCASGFVDLGHDRSNTLFGSFWQNVLVRYTIGWYTIYMYSVYCPLNTEQHVNGFPECNFIFPIAPQRNEVPAVFTLLPLQNAHVHPLRRIFYANANAMIVVNHNKQKDQSRNAIVNKKNIRRFSSMRSISRGQDILFQYSYSWVNAEHLPPHRAYIRE